MNALSPLHSLHVLDLLRQGPSTTGDIAALTGLPRADAHTLLRTLQDAGLVCKAADRAGTLRLHHLTTLDIEPDEVTQERVLAEVERQRTVAALVTTTDLPRSVITDVLARALWRGEVRCRCIGSLGVFTRSEAWQPSLSGQPARNVNGNEGVCEGQDIRPFKQEQGQEHVAGNNRASRLPDTPQRPTWPATTLQGGGHPPMTRRLTLLALLALVSTPAVALKDVNVLLTPQQAQRYTLTLGPGALGTLVFPEAVKDVLVTRDGLVDRRKDGNRVLLAGLAGYGSTPLQIVTESGTYTWRLTLSSDHAGSIVNVTVQDPEETSPAPPTPQASAPTASLRPGAALGAEETPHFTFTATRDGNVLVMNYRVQAGSRAVTLNERQLAIHGQNGGSVLVKTNLSTLVVAPGTTRYGTVTASAADAGATPTVLWPYRVGINEYTSRTTLNVTPSSDAQR